MQSDWIIFHRNIGEVRAVGFQSRKAINTHVRRHFLVSEERWEQAVRGSAQPPAAFRERLDATPTHEHGDLFKAMHDVYFESIRRGCSGQNIVVTARGSHPRSQDDPSRGHRPSVWVASQLGIFAAFEETPTQSVLVSAYRPLPPVTTGPKTTLRSYVRRARNKVIRLAGKRFGSI